MLDGVIRQLQSHLVHLIAMPSVLVFGIQGSVTDFAIKIGIVEVGKLVF